MQIKPGRTFHVISICHHDINEALVTLCVLLGAEVLVLVPPGSPTHMLKVTRMMRVPYRYGAVWCHRTVTVIAC